MIGGRPRPFAGMTRIRFKGFGVSPSQPRSGRPSCEALNLGLANADVKLRPRKRNFPRELRQLIGARSRRLAPMSAVFRPDLSLLNDLDGVRPDSASRFPAISKTYIEIG